MSGRYQASPTEMRALFDQVAQERQTLFRGISDAQLDRVQQYRDSKGSLYQATLRHMLLQMIIHATHHRAQAVNALRRVGAAVPEVDYMHQVASPCDRDPEGIQDVLRLGCHALAIPGEHGRP